MADFRVTIEEDILLHGVQMGSTRTLEVANVSDAYKRIVKCPSNSETTVAHFHSSVADGQLPSIIDMQLAKYIRVTNLSTATSITLSMQIDINENDSSADHSASLLIQPGRSFIMGQPEDGIGVSDANANLVTDLVDLESLVVFTGATAVEVEVMIISSDVGV
tara:strand:- start:3472 stop:3960 length:489 start_codon:yes stop_codon:yes gene_type:complete